MSATAELVVSRMNEIVVSRKPEITEGFEIFQFEAVAPLVVKSQRGRPRGSKNKEVKAKRGRGRPVVYNGTHRRIAAAALRHNGLTGAMKFLEKERSLKVSLTFLYSVAKQFGITFLRGRPKAA